jgi:hypothetical protein
MALVDSGGRAVAAGRQTVAFSFEGLNLERKRQANHILGAAEFLC